MDETTPTTSDPKTPYLIKGTADLLADYLRRFSNLHRAALKGGAHAPHKPVLLLALLGEVESGGVRDNVVTLSGPLVARFCAYWEALVPQARSSRGIVYPFRYLIYEGFWELLRNEKKLTPDDLGHPTSIGQLNAVIDYGRFAPDLWMLLQDPFSLSRLKEQLISTYFEGAQTHALLPASPMAYQIERLKTEAQARFRSRWISEPREDSAYIRHTLFPNVIRSLYGDTCAMCHVKATVGSASVIEAAHIMPFSDFHNDDPRNGLALCKNHHWAFDQGAITVADDYTIQMSRQIQATPSFIPQSARIALPTESHCFPALDALAWHCKNRWLG